MSGLRTTKKVISFGRETCVRKYNVSVVSMRHPLGCREKCGPVKSNISAVKFASTNMSGCNRHHQIRAGYLLCSSSDMNNLQGPALRRVDCRVSK